MAIGAVSIFKSCFAIAVGCLRRCFPELRLKADI
jgi:hypothetical protein